MRRFTANCSFTPEQTAQATFSLDDAERLNWHFVPRARKGLPFKTMTPPQRALAHALLSTGLSQRGYVSALTIMSLEQVLAEIEQGKGPVRDAELYYITIFGKPTPTGAWGWRLEGHHLSLNFTLIGNTAIAATPAFFGSNPARVLTGPRQGLRIFDQEEDQARALVRSLDDAQRKLAIISPDAPKDIITGNQRKAALLTPTGIRFADLTDIQRQALQNLIALYARRLRPEIADDLLARISRLNPDQLHFAWAGSLEPNQSHYYRIQGPTFLVEYDDTQNNANHIHTVWRDLEHDFGEDLLQKHYQESRH